MSEVMINAAVVAELRRETGAGMMDCKQALAESGGDKEKALEYLRKKGKAAAEKRSQRAANEGVMTVAQSPDGKTAALVEVNCETDFVSRNEDFQKFAKELAEIVLAWKDANGKSVDDLQAKSLSNGKTIADALIDLIGKIGEKIEIKRFARVHSDNGFIANYIHSDGKLGVLVELEGVSGTPEVITLGRDLAMQIAAASPSAVNRSEVDADKIAYETKFHTDQVRAEGKPEGVIEKIVQGKIDKWLAEVALLEQAFVKDPKITIKAHVENTAKAIGKPINVKSFTRFRVGQ